jgi:DNA-binding MarR family transcriptional regulator
VVTSGVPAAQAERLRGALLRLIRFESRRLAGILAQYDLTMPQYFTLQALRTLGPGGRMGDLAHRMCHSSATTTGLVERLEEACLVERIMDPADRRAVQVRITARGDRLLDDVAHAQRERLAGALGRLEAADREELLCLVQRYLDTLAADAPHETGGYQP